MLPRFYARSKAPLDFDGSYMKQIVSQAKAEILYLEKVGMSLRESIDHLLRRMVESEFCVNALVELGRFDTHGASMFVEEVEERFKNQSQKPIPARPKQG